MQQRLSFFAAAAVLMAASATAQVGIGLRGGATLGGVSTTNDGRWFTESPDPTNYEFTIPGYAPGFVIGIPVEVQLGPSFTIQTEVNFMRRSFRQQIDFYPDAAFSRPSARVSYTALEVPLLAKFGKLRRGVTVAGVVGPSVQYVTGARERFYPRDLGPVTKVDFDDPAAQSINRFALFSVLGAELGIPLPFAYLTVDARYRHQINDADARAEDTERARVFSLAAGVRVPVALLRSRK